jgi:hypothetical protein
MDVKILNSDLELIKVLDAFDSLVWNTRYNSIGDFQLVCTNKYFKLLQEGNIIQNTEDDEFLGKIEKIKVSTDERAKKKTLTVSGRMIEKMLDQRVIMKGVYSQSIEPAEFVSLLLDRNAINPEEPERKIIGLSMGTKPASDYGPIAYENVYSNLLDTTERVLQSSELGFKMATNLEIKSYIFNIYKGKNLTQGQSDNPPVILSKDFDNILTSEYEKDIKNYKNVIYIKGEGEFKTSISTGNYSSLERREMFVDLTSTSRTLEDGTVLSDVDYSELLQQSAIDYLKKAIKEELLYNSLNLNSNYKYKEDFDLGDVITCADSDLDFSIDLRIVEVNQVWDKKSGYSIYLNLGETKASLKNYVENIISGKIQSDSKKEIEAIKDGTIPAGSADKLTTARMINGIEFDGQSDINIGSTTTAISGMDTRSINSPPSEYMSSGTLYKGRAAIIPEFKSNITLGNGLTGTYCILVTFVPWTDSSGGYPFQICMGASGIKWRVGTSTTAWSVWTVM